MYITGFYLLNQNCLKLPALFDDPVSLQYIPRNIHTVFTLLCFVMIMHWLIFPYPTGLLHWHCGNLTIAPVPAKQPWWIWINTSFEFIMNDYIATTKQSTTKPCAYFLGYTVPVHTMSRIFFFVGLRLGLPNLGNKRINGWNLNKSLKMIQINSFSAQEVLPKI